MFASSKELRAVQRELQQTRLVVDHLRRAMTRVQAQLRALDGWGDDFLKTYHIADAETRQFFRELEATDGATALMPELPDELPSVAESVSASGVRRRAI